MTAVVLLLCMEAMLADDYRIREHGSAVALHLTRTRPARCSALAIASGHHPSAEVRSRCTRLVAALHAFRASSYTPKTVPRWPCLDMVPADMPRRWEFITHWRDRAGWCDHGAAGAAPYWRGWRTPTELWVRDMIRRERWTYADADAVLGEMWLAELAYHERGFPTLVPVVRGWRKWDGGYPGR